jgi:hypothetical protein
VNGSIRYYPHPSEVEVVTVIESGDGGQIRRGDMPVESPVLVESANGDRWVAPRAMLFTDRAAACIASAQIDDA